jgi:hypothetical protein
MLCCDSASASNIAAMFVSPAPSARLDPGESVSLKMAELSTCKAPPTYGHANVRYEIYKECRANHDTRVRARARVCVCVCVYKTNIQDQHVCVQEPCDSLRVGVCVNVLTCVHACESKWMRVCACACELPCSRE